MAWECRSSRIVMVGRSVSAISLRNRLPTHSGLCGSPVSFVKTHFPGVHAVPARKRSSSGALYGLRVEGLVGLTSEGNNREAVVLTSRHVVSVAGSDQKT